MTKKKVERRTCINHNNYDWTIHGETPMGVSLTEPDQSMTMKELVQRFTRQGIHLQPELGEDLEFEQIIINQDLDKMSEIEKRDLAKELAEDINKVKELLDKSKEVEEDRNVIQELPAKFIEGVTNWFKAQESDEKQKKE